MVYIFSEFTSFESIKINEFKENIKLIRLNLENYNYEVIFYFESLEKLIDINFDYDLKAFFLLLFPYLFLALIFQLT